MAIEVACILLFFALSFTGPITTNFLLDRTCVVILGHNESDCALLGTDNTSSATQDLEKQVQPYANDISMVQSFVLSTATILFCFFIGSWIDKNGRKPALLMGILGFTLYMLIILIIYLIPHATPWWLTVGILPVILTGGFPTFMTVMLCYVSDVSSENQRGLRMGIFEGSMAVGGLIGTLSSSYAFNATGYVTMYSISVVCCFLSFLYALLFVPELAVPEQSEIDRNKPLFNIAMVKSTFQAYFKQREDRGRLILILLTVMLVVSYLNFTCADSFSFVYTREKFNWSLKTYTYYSCFKMIMAILGGSVGIYLFQKVCGVSEIIMILFGFIGIISSVIIVGFAQKSWLLYAAGSLHFLAASVSPLSRSMISKITDERDEGKIFSVISAMETLTAMAGNPFYTFIYNSTLNSYPSLFYFVSAGFLTIGIVCAMAIIIIKRNDNQVRYNELNE